MIITVVGGLHGTLHNMLTIFRRMGYVDGRLDWREEGLVIVAAPGKHLTVRGDMIKLQAGEPVHGCCPSVDVLFESLARWQEDRAIGVVLTGMGRDGAQGAMAMKSRGGYIIAQSEETCTIFGMPKAVIDLKAATSVVPLEEIPTTLMRLTESRRERTPPSPGKPDPPQ